MSVNITPFLLICAMLFACNKSTINENFSEISHICQSSPRIFNDALILIFKLTSDKKDLEKSSLYQVYGIKKNGDREALDISPGHCIFTDNSFETIVAWDSKREKIGEIDLNQFSDQLFNGSTLFPIPLKEYILPHMITNCENLSMSNHRLNLTFSKTTHYLSASYEIDIININNPEDHQTLNLKGIPLVQEKPIVFPHSGSYQIMSNIRDPFGQEQQQELCRVHALVGEPKVTATSDSYIKQEDTWIIVDGSNITLESDRPHAKIFYCIAPEDSESCDSYQDYLEPILPAPGRYCLYFFAEDLAGNTSLLKSQNIWVDTSSPSIEVEWHYPELNSFPYFSHAPYANFLARIDVSDDVSSLQKLRSRTQCRLRLVGASLPLSNLGTCLSDSCKGRSLHDWVPCKNEIAFSFQPTSSQPQSIRLWQEIIDAQIILDVRTTDEALKKTTVSKGFRQSSQMYSPFGLLLLDDIHIAATRSKGRPYKFSDGWCYPSKIFFICFNEKERSHIPKTIQDIYSIEVISHDDPETGYADILASDQWRENIWYVNDKGIMHRIEHTAAGYVLHQRELTFDIDSYILSISASDEGVWILSRDQVWSYSFPDYTLQKTLNIEHGIGVFHYLGVPYLITREYIMNLATSKKTLHAPSTTSVLKNFWLVHIVEESDTVWILAGSQAWKYKGDSMQPINWPSDFDKDSLSLRNTFVDKAGHRWFLSSDNLFTFNDGNLIWYNTSNFKVADKFLYKDKLNLEFAMMDKYNNLVIGSNQGLIYQLDSFHKHALRKHPIKELPREVPADGSSFSIEFLKVSNNDQLWYGNERDIYNIANHNDKSFNAQRLGGPDSTFKDISLDIENKFLGITYVNDVGKIYYLDQTLENVFSVTQKHIRKPLQVKLIAKHSVMLFSGDGIEYIDKDRKSFHLAGSFLDTFYIAPEQIILFENHDEQLRVLKWNPYSSHLQTITSTDMDLFGVEIYFKSPDYFIIETILESKFYRDGHWGIIKPFGEEASRVGLDSHGNLYAYKIGKFLIYKNSSWQSFNLSLDVPTDSNLILVGSTLWYTTRDFGSSFKDLNFIDFSHCENIWRPCDIGKLYYPRM